GPQAGACGAQGTAAASVLRETSRRAVMSISAIVVRQGRSCCTSGSKETHRMALQLFFHPFSSYCQKALVALYENAVPFEEQLLDGPDGAASLRLAELWPMKRFPVLVDGDRTIIEATCIIEYVGLRLPGPARSVPHNPVAGVEGARG